MTFQRSISYGAFLQTYALSSYLRENGHEVQVIDYHPEHRLPKLGRWTWKYAGLHPWNGMTLLRRAQFKNYIQRYLPLSDRRYRTPAELEAEGPKCEAYVCGSDQIWNPVHTGGQFDAGYFAAFGPEAARRIAYAPSFGAAGLAPHYHADFCANVKGLDFLSAREQSGADLISHITGRAAISVLDPTLLNVDFRDIMRERTRQKEYILVYRVQRSALILAVARRVSAATGLPLWFVGDSIRPSDYSGRICLPTPGGWLGLIKNAATVVTNSFHGTVVSILFRKRFLSVGLVGSDSNRSTRITELLDTLGLTQQFLEEDREEVIRAALGGDLDWDRSFHLLRDLRRTSEQYLHNALN